MQIKKEGNKTSEEREWTRETVDRFTITFGMEKNQTLWLNK